MACSIVCFVVTYTFSSQNLLLKTDYNKNKYGRSLLTLVQIKKEQHTKITQVDINIHVPENGKFESRLDRLR